MAYPILLPSPSPRARSLGCKARGVRALAAFTLALPFATASTLAWAQPDSPGPEADRSEPTEPATAEPAPPPASVVTPPPVPTVPPQPTAGPPPSRGPAPPPAAAATLEAQAPADNGGIRVESLRIGAFFQPAFVVQGNTEFNNDDEDGFQFRNARLTGEGRIPIDTLLATSFHFNFDVATGVFLVKDVYGSIHLGEDWVVADVGQMKAPFLLAELTPESELQLPTPAEGVRRIAYGRDRGIRLRGSLEPGGIHIGWAAAMQNGEGPTVAANTDSEFLYTGRLELGPLGDVPMSEPDLKQSPFGIVIGGSGGTTQSTSRNTLGLGDVGAKEVRVEGDLRMRFRGLTLRGEYVRATVDPADARERFLRYGAYAQLGWVLPLPWRTRFELVTRWEQSDLNDDESGLLPTGGAAGGADAESLGGSGSVLEYAVPDNSEVRRVEVGVNSYILEHRLKVQGSWVRTDYLEGPKTEGGGNPIVGDLFQLQLQFGWI